MKQTHEEIQQEITKSYNKMLRKLSVKKREAYFKWIDLFMHQHRSE